MAEESIYTKLVNELEELKKQYRVFCEEAFAEAFAAFFKDHHEVKTVYWYQYTPYFNDGDPCEFGVHEIMFSPIEWSEIDSAHFDDELEEDEKFAFNNYSRDDHTVDGKLKTDMREFDQLMNSVEEHLDIAFGDAFVRAYIDDSGEVAFETEEYEHD